MLFIYLFYFVYLFIESKHMLHKYFFQRLSYLFFSLKVIYQHLLFILVCNLASVMSLHRDDLGTGIFSFEDLLNLNPIQASIQAGCVLNLDYRWS